MSQIPPGIGPNKKTFKIYDRVQLRGSDLTGCVVGLSLEHVINIYIVYLDHGHDQEWAAYCIPASELELMEGT